MNKTELVAEAARKTDMSQTQVNKVLEAITSTIINTVAEGDLVRVTGFGTFEKRVRAARTGINPQTRERIDIPATPMPVFKAGSIFRDRIRQS